MKMARTTPTTVSITSDTGEELTWDISSFNSGKMSSSEELFKEVNGYLLQAQPENRKRIFAVYKEIHHEVVNASSSVELEPKLTKLVSDLYNEIPLSLVESWLSFYGDVTYRADLKERHSPDDRNPGRTYLKSDYKDLVSFATMLRFLIPILGEYIPIIRRTIRTDVTQIKEYFSLRIIRMTELVECRGFQRLQRYVAAYARDEELKMNSAIIKQLSSAEKIDYVTAHTVVRRLAGGEVDADVVKGDLISNIFSNVKHLFRTMDGKFGGYNQKYPTEQSGDAKDESSLVERWRITQSITTGDKQTFSVFLRDVTQVCLSRDPTIPTSLINEVVRANKDFKPIDILDHHTLLSQWVLAGRVAHEAIPSMHGQERIATLVASQALIIHWGFPVLGLLATASVINRDEYVDTIADQRDQPTHATVDKLNKLFPYQNSKGSNARQSNYAYVAVTTWAKMVRGDIWQVRIPKSLREEFKSVVENHNRMIVPPGIAELMAQLIIFISEKHNEEYAAKQAAKTQQANTFGI